MKKNILFFAMMMLLSSTCISTFANNPNNDPMPITGAPNIPIRKSPHMSYIIESMDNGVCSLTFMRAFDNAEIRIYQNGILIDQNSGSFEEGETYTLDLQGYEKGEYTIEVYYSGNKIFSSSEEI
jgi:hypothetical protein